MSTLNLRTSALSSGGSSSGAISNGICTNNSGSSSGNSSSSNNSNCSNINLNSISHTQMIGDISSPMRSPKPSLMSLAASYMGNIKAVILVAICVQNAGYTLLRKYSVQTENVSSKEILMISELIKLAVSIWFILSSDEPSDAVGKGIAKLMWLVNHSGKMLVLAAIYGTMNILSFVALQYIGAGEFTICAQLKVLTTAGFSVLILKTGLTWTKWRALSLLVLGCTLVAYSTNVRPYEQTGAHELQTTNSAGWQMFGYGAVLMEVCLSGFASIYFEKVVKSKSEMVTIWERNFQLSMYSILLYLLIIIYDSLGSQTENTRTFASNWSFLTVVVSILGAAGGLLVAATLKYADSILKTLATAGAIVISTVLGHYFLNGPLDLVIVIGALTAIIAIADYTLDATPSYIIEPKTAKDVEKQ